MKRIEYTWERDAASGGGDASAGPRRYLREADAAAFIGAAPATMRTWRCRRVVPPWIRMGARAVVYAESDLIAFLEARRVDPGGGRATRRPHRAAARPREGRRIMIRNRQNRRENNVPPTTPALAGTRGAVATAVPVSPRLLDGNGIGATQCRLVMPRALRPTTAGAWLALVAALLECPSEAYVVPPDKCPPGGVRALVRRLHAHRRGGDFRHVWASIEAEPAELKAVRTAEAAFDACPDLLDDGRPLHVAFCDAYDDAYDRAREGRRA